ncbi:SpoIIE family protein phosphatase [Embleya sp. NPDC050493]|uniref:SpoIIE family protein phosphatase n=1 Tax=Embleya sp. NPDC050493 TaxID=3363989 RepID=UPI00378D2342
MSTDPPRDRASDPGPDAPQPHPDVPAGRRSQDAHDHPPTAGTKGRRQWQSLSAVGRLAATVERLHREVKAAQAAADGRALIELAKGILVERLRCSPTQAARQLTALAERAGVSEMELAADIVNRTAADRLTEAARDFVTETGRPTPPDPDPVGMRLRTAESGAWAATDTEAVARSLLEHALAPLGATAVAVWAVTSDGSLTLAGSAGFTEHEATRWRHVPPGVATVARRALTDLDWVWIPTLAEAGVPSIGQHHLTGARAAVPAGTGGRVHGILEICWPHTLPAQPARIRRQIEALAELSAHTLEVRSPNRTAAASRPAAPGPVELVDIADCLHDSAMVLVPHLDGEGRLADFRVHHTNRRFVDPAGRPAGLVSGSLLLEAYPLAANPGGLYDIIERVYATGEPYRAERVTLTALVDQVPLDATADVAATRQGDAVLVIWRIEHASARLANLLQHAQRLGRIGGFEEDVRTGRIAWSESLFALHGLPYTAAPIALRDLPLRAHPDDGVALDRFLRTLLHHHRNATVAFRLERVDGVTRRIRIIAEPVLDSHGRLTAVRGAYQDVSAQHWTEVALAVTRDRLAHSEQQATEHDRLARQLQHAIMPPTHTPPAVTGLNVAVRYRPAASDAAVGGDWYDVVILPSDHILLCVGDVAGHGIDAATSMIVLRNALRGLAITGAGPAQLLAWLNMVAHHLTDRVTATAVCGLYDPTTRIMRWARAGHLPPVLIRAHQAQTLPLLEGPLLGAFADVIYDEDEVRLAADDTLLMYTDGLIERRDRSLQESLEQLLITARTDAATVEDRLDRILTHSRADTDDDTCIIGLQVT